MKALLLSLIFFSIFSSNCQIIQPISGDSLGKYSYQILGITNGSNETDFGTCFFVENNAKLFLVTAKHVLYKCDSITNKLFSPFNFAIVYIRNSTKFLQFPIPVRNEICISMERDTDILAIEIDRSWLDHVNRVNEFMLPPFNKVGDSEIFGQGMYRDSVSMGFTNPHHIHLKSNTFKIEGAVKFDNSDYTDSVNYTFAMKEINGNKSIKGFSGSPVFLQDEVSKKWRVAGVLTGGANASKGEFRTLIFVAKQDYLMQYLN